MAIIQDKWINYAVSGIQTLNSELVLVKSSYQFNSILGRMTEGKGRIKNEKK